MPVGRTKTEDKGLRKDVSEKRKLREHLRELCNKTDYTLLERKKE